jgi:type VI secretion system secreted protein VgrG
MEITTPLGPDVLLFHKMRARDELSRLSEYHLELLSHPDRGEIDVTKMIGQPVTVSVELPDETRRYFNGIVRRFGQIGKHGRYNRFFAEVVPWVWALTRTADCRIFQEMTVPDIVRQVLVPHASGAPAFELTGDYRKWIYCVQYRETDFNFVSRLLEHEGIYYYFRHTDGQHAMVLTDSTGRASTTPGYETLSYYSPDQFVRPEVEYVREWDFSLEVQPEKYTQRDHDFEVPHLTLETQKSDGHAFILPRGEIYEYPGGYRGFPGTELKHGEHYTKVRIEELATLGMTARGLTNARGLVVGSLFTLDGAARSDQNGEHLIISTTYDLEFSDYEAMPDPSPEKYSCTFSAMPTAVLAKGGGKEALQFRPRRITPKPFVQGPQTAVVVGPPGEEIFTDKYGRVKVQFFWDREGKNDEKSSCWMRVSHPWAGKQWGGISLPRIGQEVIVDFLEGDPDQPIVTGRVYNAEQMPPYELPDNKTQSGMKTRSSLGGSPANFNEIRFEDLKGSEQLFIHAEKNQDIEVENDETHWVGHDRTKTIDHDEKTHVKHDRTETVDHDETITIGNNRKEFVGANETITIADTRTKAVNGSESVTVAMQRTHNVGVNETINVGGAQEVSVGGLQSFTVGGVQTTTVGMNQSIAVNANRSVRADKNLSTTIGKEETRKVGDGRETKVGKDDSLDVGKKLTMVAGDSIMLKTGEASITMKKNGDIVIKGKNITLEGSGKINAKASGEMVLKGSTIKGN